MKKLLIIYILLLSCNCAFAGGNSDGWNLLVNNLRTYVLANKSNIGYLSARLDSEEAALSKTVKMAEQLDRYYADAKAISFNSFLSNGKFYQHQKMLEAIQSLKIELEIWNAYHRLSVRDGSAGYQQATNKERNPDRPQKLDRRPLNQLQKDVYDVTNKTEGSIKNFIRKKTEELHGRIDQVEVTQQNHFYELEKYERQIRIGVNKSYRMERYIDLLRTFRHLEELLATIR